MTTQPVTNPWDTAMNPPKPASEWYGRVGVGVWFCALIKGQGKVTWDPNQVDPNTGNPPRRYTAIDMKLTPITDSPINDLERTMIAEFGEWPEIVLPSLKDLGITNLQSLNGQWAKLETVATGRTYKNDQGETKDATTFKFLEVYTNETTCRAAQKASRGNGQTAAPQSQAHAEAAAQSSGNGNKERETAQKFLRPYIQNALRQSGNDLDKARAVLAPMLAQQPLLAKYFTVDSPEVLDLLTTQAIGMSA